MRLKEIKGYPRKVVFRDLALTMSYLEDIKEKQTLYAWSYHAERGIQYIKKLEKALSEVGNLEIPLKKLALQKGSVIITTPEIARKLIKIKLPKDTPEIPIVPVRDINAVREVELDVEKVADKIHGKLDAFNHPQSYSREEWNNFRANIAQHLADNLKEIIK